MKRSVYIAAGAVCMVFFLTISNALAFQVVTREMVEKQIITEIDLMRTVDNFIVLFDSSSSTNQMVPGTGISKIEAAKKFLRFRNEWLPDLGYNAGLYNYTNFKTVTGTFEEIYGVQPYQREKFAAAIDKLPDKGEGPTNLLTAMLGLQKVMKGVSGETAVFIFTDGIVTRQPGFKRPLEVAQEIARDHDVNFYVISSATGDREKSILEAVSKINAESRVIPMSFFLYNPHYLGGALYAVKATSYVKLTPYKQVIGFVANDMLFDFNGDGIRDEYLEKLDMLGDFLQANPSAYVVTAGFTDSTGSEEHNIALSARRASAVQSYLVENHNIDARRVVVLWFGPLNPVGDNATPEGRQLNRRVGIAVGGLN